MNTVLLSTTLPPEDAARTIAVSEHFREIMAINAEADRMTGAALSEFNPAREVPSRRFITAQHQRRALDSITEWQAQQTGEADARFRRRLAELLAEVSS